jgi:pimeloyl-ACP methyl ester carboxylesterase
MSGDATSAAGDHPSIFLHGLVSSGQGFKGTLFRRVLPGILTPDFTGALEERMAQLGPIIGDQPGWAIIGSSFGGLMATLFTRDHPEQVRKLVLLAPALALSEHRLDPHPPIAVPTVVYHGKNDTVIPLEPLRAICEQLFEKLSFNEVDDDHRLQKTVQSLDWPALVSTQ